MSFLLHQSRFFTTVNHLRDLPATPQPEIAFAGRSNAGKSTAINLLCNQKRLAFASKTPGRTQHINYFSVGPADEPVAHLVDLPGYGYARGGAASAREFQELTRAYFGRAGLTAALLLIDARHPGLAADVEAWQWLQSAVEYGGVIATKIDKLSRGDRIRALRELQSVFDDPVLPVSAVTGEGLDELWKLIDKLANNPNPKKPRKRSRRAETAPPAPRKN